MGAKKGDRVRIEYVGKLEDGTVFDSTDMHEEPLEFEVGAGTLIRGVDEAVEGMEKDEEKDVTIPPGEAYGDRNEELIRELPKDKLPDDKLEAGQTLLVTLPDGMQLPLSIVEEKEETWVVDLNHPLAGKNLTFSIKLVEIVEEA